MKREFQIFFTALMFYTRIPCPQWVDHNAANLNEATRYFPLVGWIVAILSWIVFFLCRYIFPVEVAILLSMVAGILATGAFHEDGLADVCDGFGGGWTKEKILAIMKDSRVGTYGVAGLIFMLALKFFSLRQLAIAPVYLYGIFLIVSHSLSRLSAVLVMFTSVYVREDADSKAKPVAQQLKPKNLVIACIWAFIPLAVLVYFHAIVLLIILPVMLMTIYLHRYFKKWIGGYTGDCLGATQQVNEVVIYLSLLALWNYM
ncbi:MAG TPA: adenosylcobinamide-GDP ribazoletransferase [Ohtaekwangia sp.]|uniref:adenosylcobinamide-GDP ribazoletransferase n=1 Tax=Ohtaekwangia sp. TaxID=2066019 RepID=UPI002F94DC8E